MEHCRNEMTVILQIPFYNERILAHGILTKIFLWLGQHDRLLYCRNVIEKKSPNAFDKNVQEAEKTVYWTNFALKQLKRVIFGIYAKFYIISVYMYYISTKKSENMRIFAMLWFLSPYFHNSCAIK